MTARSCSRSPTTAAGIGDGAPTAPGLSIVRALVRDELRGTLELRGERRDARRGALPAHDPGRMRILVAEDETIIRLDLRELLERAGYEVVAEARDGEEAVALARDHEPDLADDGRQDAAPRRDRGRPADPRGAPDSDRACSPRSASDELVERAVEAGVFGYLVKPFREQDVVPAIETARARHEELAGRSRRGRVARRGARRPQGDRAREGPADGEGGAERGRRVRAPAQGEPGLRDGRCSVIAEAVIATFDPS